MKKGYVRPDIRVRVIEDICEGGFNSASVYRNSGTSLDSQFKVHESEDENPGSPNGKGSSDWYDDASNWGGD